MPSPWPQQAPSRAHRAAYADARPRAFWLDTVPARAPQPPFTGRSRAQLCIVGGGFTGLWAALHAKEQTPERDVVLLEATYCGDGASTRNGGFVDSSLTHGLGNGLARFPEEMDVLERLGRHNFDELAADLDRYEIDAEFAPVGEMSVALEPHQVTELEAEAELARRYGHTVTLLDGAAIRAEIHSPLYRAGLWRRTGAGLVNPAQLVDGLRRAALGAGVRIHEDSRVTALEHLGGGVAVRTGRGRLEAERVLLATSAYPPLVRAIGRYVAPVYDYVLMSEPLDARQLAAIGWLRRQGVGDMANQFHYYRLSADNRILWGGYDAVYRYGGPVAEIHDEHDATFARLSQHFFTTFPQLEGLRFSHRWGGAIDTCSRFAVFFGHALHGRVVYALGYTGLGVGASRFGGRTGLDLLDGRRTEATGLSLARRRPLPFPPEPLRSAVIQLTRHQLATADQREGRRGLWLRTLDRMGLGFDS